MMTDHALPLTYFLCADLQFDFDVGTVTNSFRESQRLSPINLKVLAYLVRHQGEVVSRAALFDAVWPNQIVSDDVLTRAVSDIRAQLAKLGSSTKFIETLPKRGYRWVENTALVSSSASMVVSQSIMASGGVVESASSSFHVMAPRVIVAFLYVIAAVLLASVMMWGMSQSATNQVGVAVLPTTHDRPQMMAAATSVNSDILNLLRKNPRIKLLSTSAIASRPNNPFPYFFTEFGAKWVLESRVSDLAGVSRVELSLVDARTGLELRTFGFDAALNNPDFLVKLALRLEDALADGMAY